MKIIVSGFSLEMLDLLQVVFQGTDTRKSS